jgi:hypothetical protein
MKLTQSVIDNGRSVRVTVNGVSPQTLIEDLCLVNRAYQVLYALGETSSTVRTLEPGESRCLVGIVQDLLDESKEWTELDSILFGRMSRGMIAYVAGREAE